MNKSPMTKDLVVAVPGSTPPKVGTEFGDILRADKPQNQINLEQMKQNQATANEPRPATVPESPLISGLGVVRK
jgi:hypothetical protein